ncbi:FecCD family ABC transporter permease [Thomasclavelia sp.]
MKNQKIFLIVFIIICLILFCFSLTIGSYDLSIDDILKILGGSNNSTIQQNVFYNLRLPRVVMGLFTGLVLGLAGAVYQMLFSNPLASPDLTGVASGASLGAAVAIVIGAGTAIEKTFGAFVFGMLSLVLVIVLVKTSKMQKASAYILSGIVISSLANAGIMMLKYIADPLSQLATIEFWTMGSLAAITVDKMLISLFSGLIPLIVLFLLHRQIVILSLGDENAQYLGINAKWQRAIILILATWMVASVIAITGVISFVGLIAPHIAYLMLKKRTGYFYIISSLVGAILVLVADMLARMLSSGVELPLSILTILFSTPVLVFWMYKQRGKI